MNIFLSIFGALGIGAWIGSVIDRAVEHRLEKKKIIYDKKFEAYTEFAKFSLGFNLSDDEPKNVFSAMASTAKVNLLLPKQDQVERIQTFVIDLDAFYDLTEDTPAYVSEYERLQAESKEIVDMLKSDLDASL
jgi:hypothetical protein